MSARPIYAHVPVDRVEIVNGPSAETLREVMRNLAVPLSSSSFRSAYIGRHFTLRTHASGFEFIRTVRLSVISEVFDNNFEFTADFAGQIVQGDYSATSRWGGFSLVVT